MELIKPEITICSFLLKIGKEHIARDVVFALRIFQVEAKWWNGIFWPSRALFFSVNDFSLQTTEWSFMSIFPHQTEIHFGHLQRRRTTTALTQKRMRRMTLIESFHFVFFCCFLSFSLPIDSHVVVDVVDVVYSTFGFTQINRISDENEANRCEQMISSHIFRANESKQRKGRRKKIRKKYDETKSQ